MNRSRPYAMLAEFETVAHVLAAAVRIRAAGYRYWDVHTPFPVHGLDTAMGVRQSPVGWFTFGGGVGGFTLGMLMVWYMNAFDYALNVGAKPFFSPIFSFPIAFELTILLGALGTVLGMFGLNRLPRLYQPLLKHRRFARCTQDRFFVVIECRDPKYSEAGTRQLLASIGGRYIEVIED